MNVFEYIRENRDLTVRLAELELMKYKVEAYFAIYTRYRHYITAGNTKTEAIRKACRDFHTCEKTGWLVIKQMEKQI